MSVHSALTSSRVPSIATFGACAFCRWPLHLHFDRHVCVFSFSVVVFTGALTGSFVSVHSALPSSQVSWHNLCLYIRRCRLHRYLGRNCVCTFGVVVFTGTLAEFVSVHSALSSSQVPWQSRLCLYIQRWRLHRCLDRPVCVCTFGVVVFTGALADFVSVHSALTSSQVPWQTRLCLYIRRWRLHRCLDRPVCVCTFGVVVFTGALADFVSVHSALSSSQVHWQTLCLYIRR